MFEVEATSRGITHHLLVPSHLSTALVSRVNAAILGVRLSKNRAHTSTPLRKVRAAAELRMTTPWQPLALERSEAAVAAVLSGLYPLAAREVVRVQWIFCGTRHIRMPAEPPAEVARAVKQKQAGTLMDAVGCVAVGASHRARARLLLTGITNALAVLDTPGVALSTRPLPSKLVAYGIEARALPLGRWPMLTNASEAAALVALPVAGVRVPGFRTSSRRSWRASPITVWTTSSSSTPAPSIDQPASTSPVVPTSTHVNSSSTASSTSFRTCGVHRGGHVRPTASATVS